MSRKSAQGEKRVSSVDRRARRTRFALAEALMDLSAREGFDLVDVRKLTMSAGVGRSTFYKHFANKDDFFIKSFAGMLQAADARMRATRASYVTMLPAHEVFAHVEQARAFALSLAASGQLALTTAAREDVLRGVAERNLKRTRPGLALVQRRQIAAVLASTFTGLMRLWIEDGMKKSAADIAKNYDSFAMRILQH